MMKPFLIGSAMAAMMLWMGHERIMSGSFDLTTGAMWFALAHLGVGLVILALALLIPSVRRMLRGHRPSAGHVLGMAAGMIATAGVVHLAMHGVLA